MNQNVYEMADATLEAEFKAIIERMVRAHWLMRRVDDGDVWRLYYSDAGAERIRRLTEIIKPIAERLNDKAKPKLSFFPQLVIGARAWWLMRELSPPAITGFDVQKMIALVVTRERP